MNNKILEVLTENIKKEDFEAIYEILNIIKEEESMLYIEWILHFMEENPKIDYGMPGPLVHFMEKKYKKGYEKLLLESIKYKVTVVSLICLELISSSGVYSKRVWFSLVEFFALKFLIIK